MTETRFSVEFTKPQPETDTYQWSARLCGTMLTAHGSTSAEAFTRLMDKIALHGIASLNMGKESS